MTPIPDFCMVAADLPGQLLGCLTFASISSFSIHHVAGHEISDEVSVMVAYGDNVAPGRGFYPGGESFPKVLASQRGAYVVSTPQELVASPLFSGASVFDTKAMCELAWTLEEGAWGSSRLLAKSQTLRTTGRHPSERGGVVRCLVNGDRRSLHLLRLDFDNRRYIKGGPLLFRRAPERALPIPRGLYRSTEADAPASPDKTKE